MKRVVLMTGISGGIGQAAARLFSERGWAVAGVDVRPGAKLSEGDIFIQADCSDPEQIKSAIARASKVYGRLDALINNAAVQSCGPALTMALDDWDKVLNVNLRAAFLFSKEAHFFLKASGGSIVNISSVHAVATSINIAAYAAAKGGLSALTRALAVEWAPDKIRVNSILPGAVDTPMLREGLTRGHFSECQVDALMQKLANKTVLGRVARPDEIAQAIFFLADSAGSSFITGQSLVVDGGATIRLSTE
ncbi:MAG: SDR family oxidoreductase [Candidatus Omnitrophica bacterium]|nr:SDR family oxidoreductase [Candidatus Omnitrophota bacterium]